MSLCHLDTQFLSLHEPWQPLLLRQNDHLLQPILHLWAVPLSLKFWKFSVEKSYPGILFNCPSYHQPLEHSSCIWNILLLKTFPPHLQCHFFLLTRSFQKSKLIIGQSHPTHTMQHLYKWCQEVSCYQPSPTSFCRQNPFQQSSLFRLLAQHTTE